MCLFPSIVRCTVVFISFVNACVPLYWRQYGNVGYYCWITQPTSGIGHTIGFSMRFSLRYGQAIIVCVVNTVLYFKVKKHLTALSKTMTVFIGDDEDPLKKAKDLARQWQYYPGTTNL